LFKEHPEIVWAVIASFYIGNAVLLVMNLPMIPMWVSMLRIPTPVLYTVILGFCVIGAYSVHESVFDVGLTLGFGILGYLYKKLDFPIAPTILTIILGPMMERAMRSSLDMSRGDFTIFFTRPISVGLLVLAAIFVVSSFFRASAVIKKDTVI
jgi:putative tricarboxylic transport membrane protein